jgi:hypothetical protein
MSGKKELKEEVIFYTQNAAIRDTFWCCTWLLAATSSLLET